MDKSAKVLQDVASAFLVIVKAMVDSPEQVRLDIIPGAAETVFRLRTSSRDCGMLIGKQGRTARSLRIRLAAIGITLKQPLALDIATVCEDEEQ